MTDDIFASPQLQPLNVDSLSKDGFQRTYLNKPKPKDNSLDLLPEDEKERLQREFINEHEQEIKQFGMLSKFDDSRRFLQEKPHLVCDWTNNYLIIWYGSIGNRQGSIDELFIHRFMQYYFDSHQF